MSILNKEWENFVGSNYTNLSSDEEDFDENQEIEEIEEIEHIKDIENLNNEKRINSKETPKSSDIYISTKTKIAYLNIPIDL